MSRTIGYRHHAASAAWLAAALWLTAATADVFEIRQGTNLSVAIDPDSASLVIDLLGGLWQMPVTGGGASPLIPAGSGIAQPRFDPAGERVVFQRWLDNQWDIWQLTLADGVYAPLTETSFNEREPEYSPDGQRIVFSADRDGSYRIWSLDLATGTLAVLTGEPGDSRFPAYSSTGELAYTHRTGSRSSLRLFSQGAGSTPLVTRDGLRIAAPSWRPGGGVIVYNESSAGQSSDLGLYIDADLPIQRRLTGSEDVFVGRVAWVSPAEYIYAADGQLWRRRIASTERDPIHLFAGTNVETVSVATANRNLDAPGPYRAAGINGLVRHDASGLMAFSAIGDLWLIDDDQLSQLTDDAATDAWPNFSPDGEWLIFASDRGGDMEIWRQRIDTGQRLQLTQEPGHSFLPRISDDGRYVAYLETRGDGPWDAAALKLVEIDRPFQSETLATGLYDASDLTWQGSRLRLLARDRSARETLPRIFETPAAEIAARPQSSQPRLPSGSPLPTWRSAAATEPYVIQAGRVFDGTSDSYMYRVDIHIDGQRITNMVRRGALPLPDTVIDASNQTVVPGLIDVHVHHSTVAGSGPGREWLRYGVTTVREAMASTGEALERAEIWSSGRSPGPRLVITPATPPTGLELPASSPILLGGGGIARSLSHDLAEQMEQADEPVPQAPAIIATGNAGGLPALSVSTLGRSYQDIIGQLRMSGAWLPTGLGALQESAPANEIGNLTATVERIIRSSGRVAIGSEAPAVAYGAGFHDELALLAERGILNDQILRWATAGGALALGLSHDTGTLDSGKLADLLIIDGDPLADIMQLRRIEAVVRGGIVYRPDDLAAPR